MNDCANPNSVAYKCKFCGREGIAQYDADCPPIRLERWQPLLACNRCADFHSVRERLKAGLWAICYTLAVVLESGADESVRKEAIRQSRERLNKKTKAFAEHICAFHRKMTIWEPDFTQMLLDAPRKCQQILAHYERGVAP